MKTHPRSGGFTLLEILIAMFIFAIVISVLFGSYRAVFMDIGSITRGGDYYEMAKDCINRITLDLQSTYVSFRPQYSPPDIDDDPDPYRIEGKISSIGGNDFSSLRFAADSHIGFERPPLQGIAQIVYYVQDRGPGQYVLRRSDSLYPYDPFEENKSDPVLCDHVLSLSFTYYDQDGESYDSWDSDSDDVGFSTPGAIGIRLEIGDADFSREFETVVTLPVYRPEKK